MPKASGRCRLCDQDRDFVESHIFPRALVREISQGDQVLSKVSRASRSIPQRLPTGPYDRFLCEECELSFGTWDSYGVDFIRRRNVNSATRRATDGHIGVEVLDPDYANLKLFVLSILWRAAVSPLQRFGSVQLGPLANELRDRIKARDPGAVDDFSVQIEHITNAPLEALLPWTENRTRDGLRFYDAFIFGHLFHVKVDSGSVQGPLRSFLLAPERPLVLHLVDFGNSSVAQSVARFFDARTIQDAGEHASADR